MTSAIITVSATLECTVMKLAGVLGIRALVKDAHPMSHAAEKQCAYMKQLYRHMEHVQR